MVAARSIPAALPPLRLGAPLPPRAFATLRRRAVFECCKWDPQVEDVSTIAPFPLWIARAAWRELASLSSALHQETLAMECALVDETPAAVTRFAARARELAVPPMVRNALAARNWLGRAQAPLARAGPRVMRFDFHLTREGWRISEVNCDVPGGYVEASGVTALFAQELEAAPVGDPAGTLVDAVVRALPTDGPRSVGLVHATGYADDRQVMELLRRRFHAVDVDARMCSPDLLDMRDGYAGLDGALLGALVRFYPAEWLANLSSNAVARAFFRGLRTPSTNPGACLLVQSKRLPLLWDDLGVEASTWRALLPETRDVRDTGAALNDDGWVIKPALGRVGAEVSLAGATAPKERTSILRNVRRHPGGFVAQRRFDTVPLENERGAFYPCIGVFTIDGVAAGAYGRLARTPLIDHRAQDVAVLIDPDERSPT